MKKMFFLLFLSCFVSLGVMAQPYPTTSYNKSSSRLFKWIGPEEEIDFSKDPALAGITYISEQAFPATVKKITLPYGFGLYDPGMDIERYFQSPGTLEHLGWEDDREYKERSEEEKHYLHIHYGGKAFEVFTSLKSLRIPCQMKLKTSQYGGIVLSDANGSYPFLERIDVSPKHTLYSSDNGILFDKRRKVLIKFPSTRTGHYEIPSQVEELSPFAFADNHLSSVSVSVNVQRIPNRCFTRASKLTTVLLPYGLRTLSTHSFSRSSQLKTIPLPEGLDSLHYSAFSQCNALPSTIKLPTSLSFISGSTYKESSVKNFVISENAPNYSTIDGVLYNKDGTTLVSYPSGRLDKEVIIPKHVSRIGSYSFTHQDSLRIVRFPEEVEEIGVGAFSWCKNLTEIEVPPTVKRIGDAAFLVTALQEMIIHQPFTIVNEQGETKTDFLIVYKDQKKSCRVISYVEMPFTLRWRYEDVKTDTLYVPTESVELYKIAPGWRYFGTIRSIKELPKPKTLPFKLSYDKKTLLRWTGNEQIIDFADYPELSSVRSIAAGAFSQNEVLRQVKSANVEKIETAERTEKGAFEQCSQLIHVDMPHLKELGNAAFYECSGLRTLLLPEVEKIGVSSAAYCSSLENLSLPKIQTIDGYAFNSCTKLSTLELSDNLKSIGDYAFSSCTSLQKISLTATEPPILGISVWGSVDVSKVDLIPPSTAEDLYRSLLQWKDFRFPNDVTGLKPLLYKRKKNVLFDLTGRRITVYPNSRVGIEFTGEKQLMPVK